MKALILVSVAFLLSACSGNGSGNTENGSSNPSNSSPSNPESLLAGKVIYFNIPGTLVDTVNLDVSGTYTEQVSFPQNCSDAGTWVDENPGSTEGTVIADIVSNGCNNLVFVSYHYTIANDTVELSLISEVSK